MNAHTNIIEIVPAQAGGFVVTLDHNDKANEYPLVGWALIDDEDPDPEIQTHCRSMHGFFYVGKSGTDEDDQGDFYLVSDIGTKGILPGESFHEYKFQELGMNL
jgi:hypothetical protein